MTSNSTNSTKKHVPDPDMATSEIKHGAADGDSNPVAKSAAQSTDAPLINTGLAIQTCCVKCEQNEPKGKYKAITCKFCEIWTCHKCIDLAPKQIELFDPMLAVFMIYSRQK